MSISGSILDIKCLIIFCIFFIGGVFWDDLNWLILIFFWMFVLINVIGLFNGMLVLLVMWIMCLKLLMILVVLMVVFGFRMCRICFWVVVIVLLLLVMVVFVNVVNLVLFFILLFLWFMMVWRLMFCLFVFEFVWSIREWEDV